MLQRIVRGGGGGFKRRPPAVYRKRPRGARCACMTGSALLDTREGLRFPYGASLPSLSVSALLYRCTGEMPRARVRAQDQDLPGLEHKCGPLVCTHGDLGPKPQCIQYSAPSHPTLVRPHGTGDKWRISEFGILPKSFSNSLTPTAFVNSKLAQLPSPRVLATSIFPANPPCH